METDMPAKCDGSPFRTAALLLCLASVLLLSCSRAAEPAMATTPIPTRGRADLPSGNTAPDSVFRPSQVPFDVAIYGDLENLNPSGQIVVYWHPHTGDEAALLDSLIDEFNSTNPWRITVLGESLGGRSQLNEAILDGLSSGRIPSLAEACAYQTASYAARGAVTPIDYYVYSARFGYDASALADFYMAALDGSYLPQFGAHYGWPLQRSADLLYYNRDWLTEMGYQTEPATWKEWANMACAAAEQPFSDAKGERVPVGYAYRPDARSFTALVASRGGGIVNADGSAYDFRGSQGLSTLTALSEMATQGCTRAMDSAQAQNEFSAGHALFVLEPANLLPVYEQAVDDGAGFEWDIQAPPRSQDMDAARLSLYGLDFVIFRGSPEQQVAAWLFVKWMSEPEQQARWVVGTARLPVRRSTGEHLGAYFAANPAYERAFRLLELDSATEPAVAGYDRCSAVIETMVTNVLAGREAEAELDSVQNQCNITLSEALR